MLDATIGVCRRGGPAVGCRQGLSEGRESLMTVDLIEIAPTTQLRRVVVLGANGAMGAGSAAMFAGGGCDVTLVAREWARLSRRWHRAGHRQVRAHRRWLRAAPTPKGWRHARGRRPDLRGVAEDLALKRAMLAEIDAAQPADALVATVSSGLSIREMAEGLSAASVPVRRYPSLQPAAHDDRHGADSASGHDPRRRDRCSAGC